MNTCKVCHRALKSPAAIAAGIGPVCAKKWGSFSVSASAADQFVRSAHPKLRPFTYKGPNGMVGTCGLFVGWLPDNRPIVLLVELKGNHGPSITNSIEQIAGQLIKETEHFETLDPSDIIWIEAYERDDAWTYDKVTFTFYGIPEWRRLPEVPDALRAEGFK